MSTRSRKGLLTASVVCATMAAGVGMACYLGIADSVHFYGSGWALGEGGPSLDFGRVPQPVVIPGWTNELQRGNEAGSDYSRNGWREQRAEDNDNETEWYRLHARNLEAAGEYRRCLNVYGMSSASNAFKRDRSEVFHAVQFRNVTGLREYLRLTYLLQGDLRKAYEPTVDALRSLKCDSLLEPHRAYALAWAYRPDDVVPKAHRYYDVYRQFPHSARAESALIMAARTLLEDRYGGKYGAGDIREARQYIALLKEKFPSSRFIEDAEGWLIRCDWLEGHEAKAVAAYKERAERGSTQDIRWSAYDSIAQICRSDKLWAKEIRFLLLQRRLQGSVRHLVWTSKELRKRFDQIGAADARVVQSEIRRSPELLESYIAFRIEDTTLSSRQERSLLRFAVASLQKMRMPTADLLERVAQIGYNNGQYRTARFYAQRALSLRARGEVQGRARYVLAASLARLGQPKEAIRQYEMLRASHVPDYLRLSGLEHLALLQERHGDRGRALQIYSELKYDLDAAYVADAEMTPHELAEYIDTCKDSGKKHVLIYTLGMRYFRKGDYPRAASAFQRLTRRQRLSYGLPASESKKAFDELQYDRWPKERDVLKSVQRLWKLDQEARNAGSKRKRAQKLYEMAVYIFDQRNLLFYSFGLWKGDRSVAITMYWNVNENTRAEKRTLDQYSYEHETLEHVMTLCREVEELGVRSPVVAKALYTEGLAAEHLSRLNQWWRGQPGLKKRAVASMKRLVRLYPHHPLAKPAAKYARVFAEEDGPNYR